MDQPEMLLKAMGLTDYETRAYITLVKLGVATADQISEVGSIPLPRVYDTLVELQNKGFVLISKGRPKKFKVVPPERALNHLIDLQKKVHEKKFKDLSYNVKYISSELKKIQNSVGNIAVRDEEEVNIWSVERRKNIVKFLDEQKSKAKKEILIFAGDMSWLEESSAIIRELKRKGIAIKALVRNPQTETMKENVKRATNLGIDVKKGYTGLLRGHVIDNQRGAVVVKTSKHPVKVIDGLPGSEEEFKYELMLVENPILIRTLKEYFNFWWNSL